MKRLIPVKLELLQTLPKRWDAYNYAECKIYYSNGTCIQKVLLTEYLYKVMMARISIVNILGQTLTESIDAELQQIEESACDEGIKSEWENNAGESL